MRNRLRIALVLAVFVTGLLPSLGRASTMLPDGLPFGDGPPLRCKQLKAKPTYIHAFHVETEWTKKAYRRSEKAVVKITITRPAHEDPLGLGLPPLTPPTSLPEEGVTAWTTISTNQWPPPYGYGATDALGQVTFKIPLKSLKPGRYDAATYGEKWTNQGGCPDIVEWGSKADLPAFTVLP
jgi:hypothetical protein